MLREPNKSSVHEPAVLTESAGIIASKGVKNLTRKANKRKKGMANGVDHKQMIATNAYYRAESRGFNSGGEIQDWLEAEAEVDGSL